MDRAGQPGESSDKDWLEAERRLLELVAAKSQVSKLHDKAGSVQP